MSRQRWLAICSVCGETIPESEVSISDREYRCAKHDPAVDVAGDYKLRLNVKWGAANPSNEVVVVPRST